MFTEHSVTYEIPGGMQVIRREVFTEGNRILGSEYTREKVWRGYEGWHERESCTETRHFRTKEEASDWIDAMITAWDVAQAQRRVHHEMMVQRAQPDDWLEEELV